jgi:hypothetical protein
LKIASKSSDILFLNENELNRFFYHSNNIFEDIDLSVYNIITGVINHMLVYIMTKEKIFYVFNPYSRENFALALIAKWK